jgi:hypothetical protein
VRASAQLFTSDVLATQHRLGASALVHPETGVLGFGNPRQQTYSQVGLILSAMRLSRSWEDGLWHAS